MRGPRAGVPACRRSGARRVRSRASRRRSCSSSPTTTGSQDLPGVGEKTAAVIVEALDGRDARVPRRSCSQHVEEPGTDAGEALRAQLKGDLHLHSDWSDGGDTIATMAEQGARPRARVLRAHRPLAAPEDRQRAHRRPAARAARRSSPSSTTSSRRSASSPASRSTSSKTARSTSPRSCSRASTSSSRACTRSCAWSRRR